MLHKHAPAHAHEFCCSKIDRIKGPPPGCPPGDTMLKIIARVDQGLEVCACLGAVICMYLLQMHVPQHGCCGELDKMLCESCPDPLTVPVARRGIW